MKHTIVTLLKKIVNHYNSSNRSINKENGQCMYLSSNGTMCPVGMCLRPEYLQKFHELEKDPEMLTGFENIIQFFRGDVVEVSEFMQDEYSDITFDQWIHIQSLHDIASCWDDVGITQFGKDKILSLFGQDIHDQVFA